MAKGGGAWKVAYADFVTAMMAFFMVMWLTSQKSDVKTAIAEHFRNPGGKHFSGSEARSMIPSSKVGNGNRRVVKSKGRQRADGDAMSRKMTDEGDRSNIGKILPFDVNSTDMNDDAIAELAELLPELAGKQYRIEIRGHAASSGGKSLQANLDAWTISYQRSLSVMKYLIDHEIEPQRIRLSQAGSSEPRESADSDQPASESRVEVFVLREVYEEAESRAQRLVNTKSLDEQAKVLAEADEAAAAAAPDSGAHSGNGAHAGSGKSAGGHH